MQGGAHNDLVSPGEAPKRKTTQGVDKNDDSTDLVKPLHYTTELYDAERHTIHDAFMFDPCCL